MKATTLKLLSKGVVISEIEAGQQKIGSVILLDDDMKEHGIHPRWGKVFKVADDVTDIKAGQWILIDHGRWTRAFDAEFEGTSAKFRFVDYTDILGVQDEHPNKNTV